VEIQKMENLNLKPKFLLGRKIGMTQIFKNDFLIPVTIILAGPNYVVGVKTKEKDGYSSVILGFGYKKNLPKPVKGILKDLGNFEVIREFRLPFDPEFKVGDVLDVDIFEIGEYVNVSGERKAKGFQGVVKRHGFSGGPKSHGQEDRLRHPGSIGGTNPQRVIKGKKMAGKISPLRVTVKNLEIVDILPEHHLLALKGSVPGANKKIVEIRSNFLSNKGNIFLTKKISKLIKV
jgi:large subunit ribosomal protein L3